MKTSHINRSRGAAWLAIAFGLASLPDHAHAAILFQDNFSGNSLDSSKWTQYDTYAWGRSSLQVENGIATFNFRPIITTTESLADAIQITGSFSLGNLAQSEALLFVTRSDGSTAGNSQEPAGLRFRFSNSGVDLEFMSGGNYTSIVGQQSFAFDNDTMYSFSIVDAGNQPLYPLMTARYCPRPSTLILGEAKAIFQLQIERERPALKSDPSRSPTSPPSLSRPDWVFWRWVPVASSPAAAGNEEFEITRGSVGLLMRESWKFRVSFAHR